jgi:cyclase
MNNLLRHRRSLTAAVVLAAFAPLASAQPPPPLEVVRLRPTFFVIVGAGGNIAVQTGQDGVVLVDSGTAALADTVLSTIRTLSDRPIRYIINTSAARDHVGGNEKIAAGGQSLFSGTRNTVSGGASIISTENASRRMSTASAIEPALPGLARPTETFNQRQKSLYLNDEGIQVMHQRAAHSDGDSIVFFRRSDVIVAGDIFDITRFPVIDVDRGGSIQGEIDALNDLIALAVPSIPLPWKEGGTYVVPGHGRICEEAELVEYRDMVTIIRDRVQDMVTRGMNLAQIKAASPAQGYTRRYGSETGAWTTSMFVEAVHRSLTAGTR